jgi:hypothetical protein
MIAAKQKEYRAKKKQTIAMNESAIKIQNAIRNRNAINAFSTRFVEKYYKGPYMASAAGVFNRLHTLMVDDID